MPICLFLVMTGVLGAQEPAAKVPDAFRFAPVDDGALGLWEGDRPVLVYNHRARAAGGQPLNPSRSAYVHPIYGLDGEVLTDDAPADHLHHRGLFWAWPHVTVGGEQVDMWILKGIEPRFGRWLFKEAGKDRDVARLGVENGWFMGDRKVLDERLILEVHRATREGRAIDVDLTWTPTDRPVTLGGAEGKSYGGLTLRYAPGEKTAITAPSGPAKDDLYMTPLPWADLTRTRPGRAERSGATIFVHPSHPGFPPTWLTRHYGVLCVGWPGVKPATIQPGEPIHGRYRVWIHKGEPDAAALEKVFKAYTDAVGQSDPAGASPRSAKP
ncbi:DUF6807 family protein [Aquisphaera giovannonii]|uniref:DUF6807 family protein n=1 Tax=Aquisphaera giovannonii TaxID=406548 RepID=UPI00143DDC1B|nr:DUF6807 family protein [Aquisphaera giovannonii]